MSVTVVIPTYNRAGLIAAAIDSVLAQTLRPEEIIVVDDGSTDDTEKVVAKYGSRVAYHRQQNGGVGTARNTGLSLAKGDYIAFLDSDDEWHPYKLELQVAVLEKVPGVHLLFTEFEILKDDGSRVHNGCRRWFGKSIVLSEFYDHTTTCGNLGIDIGGVPATTPVYFGDMYLNMLHELLALTSTSIVRREMVAAGLRFPVGIRLYEDWEFFARIARDHAIAFVDLETTINRGHKGAERLTHLSRLGKIESYVDLLDRVWKADPAFVARHGEELRKTETRALLVLTREALLASRPDVARTALARWRTVGARDRSGRALAYRLCTLLPGGTMLLRFCMRVRTVGRMILGTQNGNYSVNPAA